MRHVCQHADRHGGRLLDLHTGELHDPQFIMRRHYPEPPEAPTRHRPERSMEEGACD